jgi:hypothetical protein
MGNPIGFFAANAHLHQARMNLITRYISLLQDMHDPPSADVIVQHVKSQDIHDALLELYDEFSHSIESEKTKSILLLQRVCRIYRNVL